MGNKRDPARARAGWARAWAGRRAQARERLQCSLPHCSLVESGILTSKEHSERGNLITRNQLLGLILASPCSKSILRLQSLSQNRQVYKLVSGTSIK